MNINHQNITNTIHEVTKIQNDVTNIQIKVEVSVKNNQNNVNKVNNIDVDLKKVVHKVDVNVM